MSVQTNFRTVLIQLADVIDQVDRHYGDVGLQASKLRLLALMPLDQPDEVYRAVDLVEQMVDYLENYTDYEQVADLVTATTKLVVQVVGTHKAQF